LRLVRIDVTPDVSVPRHVDAEARFERFFDRFAAPCDHAVLGHDSPAHTAAGSYLFGSSTDLFGEPFSSIARILTAVDKKCGCGASYDMSRWTLLPLLGRQADPRHRVANLEVRRCTSCGSTLATRTASERAMEAVRLSDATKG